MSVSLSLIFELRKAVSAFQSPR